MLVVNHLSFIDWLIVGGSIRRPPRFVMDHRIARTPIVSRLFRDAKTIPIAPAREDEALMERAFDRIAEELRDGQLVCIFPEGAITRDGEMARFRSGVERIVRETPVPVVPMALDGLWGSLFSRFGGRALSRRTPGFRRRVRLEIGPPVAPDEVTAERLEREVRALLTDTELAAGTPARGEPPRARGVTIALARSRITSNRIPAATRRVISASPIAIAGVITPTCPGRPSVVAREAERALRDHLARLVVPRVAARDLRDDAATAPPSAMKRTVNQLFIRVASSGPSPRPRAFSRRRLVRGTCAAAAIAPTPTTPATATGSAPTRA